MDLIDAGDLIRDMFMFAICDINHCNLYNIYMVHIFTIYTARGDYSHKIFEKFSKIKNC